MASEQRYVQHYDKMWKNNFFALINNRTVCLLCGFEPPIIKKFVIERHYISIHFNDYFKYADQEKINLIERLKLVYQESRNPIFNIGNNAISDATKAVTASYTISHLIAKHSKPFTDGEFVKECLIKAVKSFGDSLTLAEVTSIPLNTKTVTARVNHIAFSLEEKLKDLLTTCAFYSLCLDESTDNRHVSQLSIFARIVQNDFSCVEELLDFTIA